MSSMDFHETWTLTLVQQRHDPTPIDVPVPETLEELRQSLGVDSGVPLLVSHRLHPDQQFVAERVDHLYDGATVHVHVPRRRIFITVPPDNQQKAVMWYPGATADQIERTIGKAAGFPPGTPVELRDGDASVVLSTSIPNDTVLEVAPWTESTERTSQRSGAPAVAPPAAAARSPSDRERFNRKLTSSHSTRSMSCASVRREASPRTSSPRQTPSTGNTTPAVQQSAPEEHCVHILAGHTGFIFCLCAVGDILFTGSQDGNIMIWDLNNLQYIGTLPGHRGFVKCMYASYQKKVLATGSQDRTIRVWSLDSFTTTKILSGHTGGVNAVVMLESADALISASEDRSLRIWSLDTLEMISCVKEAHLGGIFTLNVFASTLMISGARDRSLKVWDTSTWHATRTLHPPHYDGVTDIAVSAKHNKIYSGSRDRSIKEWQMGTFQNTMHTLHAHADWVQALCTSLSEDILFSASRDSTVKVWDSDLQCQDILQGHRGPVSCLATVGQRLFSASHDRTVRVWKIDQYG